MTNDFRQYYDLETYLFDKVRPRFQQKGFISAFDFFCIVIWKANRAKSYVAKNLLSHGFMSLDEAVKALTSGIFQQQSAKERLRYLFADWDFYLPMASAILTILYPEKFTIYDVNVCNTLGNFHWLYNSTNFEKLWEGYQKYKQAVEKTAPVNLSLRDKDRYLIGKSFYGQLTEDICKRFGKT